MIVDKKLWGVKTVQTLSRLNRTYPGKEDTFILDFANEAEDVQKDFQRFYHATILAGEIDVNLLYVEQRKLRDFQIYNDSDIDRFCDVYFTKGEEAWALINELSPALKRYQQQTDEQRYKIRQALINFCKWYNYVSQVVRLFNINLHREYVFCSFLVRILPEKKVQMEDIQKMLKLEMYKLEKTFEGGIPLMDGAGVYAPPKPKGERKPEDKDPLDEVIERINERYKGDFTETDKVIRGLADKLRQNDWLANMAVSSELNVFKRKFKEPFDDTATTWFGDSEWLFEDATTYNRIMLSLATILYSELRVRGRKY